MKGGAAAMALSRDLARELGQVPERSGPRVVRVPSRKTAGVFYDVLIGLDGALQCNCPASFNRLKCWHVSFVQEELDMTNEARALVPIVVKPSVELLPSSHDLDVVERAAAMAYAGAVTLPDGIKTKEQVAAVMLYGLELGLKPMTALRHLYIVKGKVAPSAEVMVGICMSKERDIAFHIEEISAEKCTIRMVRPSRNVNALYTVTWAQIKQAGLATEQNSKYPEDRLRYHCVKRLVRAYAPDLINNMDEGVVVPGIGEDEAKPWRPTVVDAGDLYNDGDEAEDAETVNNISDGVVEDVPTATEEQLVAMGEWSQAMKDHKDGRAMVSELAKVRVERWPYAINGENKFESKRLTRTDADAFIALMADIVEGRHVPAEQPALV